MCPSFQYEKDLFQVWRGGFPGVPTLNGKMAPGTCSRPSPHLDPSGWAPALIPLLHIQHHPCKVLEYRAIVSISRRASIANTCNIMQRPMGGARYQYSVKNTPHHQGQTRMEVRQHRGAGKRIIPYPKHDLSAARTDCRPMELPPGHPGKGRD